MRQDTGRPAGGATRAGIERRQTVAAQGGHVARVSHDSAMPKRGCEVAGLEPFCPKHLAVRHGHHPDVPFDDLEGGLEQLVNAFGAHDAHDRDHSARG